MDPLSQQLLLCGGSAQPGQVEFTATTTWVVPTGVYSICAVCVSKGEPWAPDSGGSRGGFGGTLAYANNIPVSPGEVLDISFSGETAIKRSGTNLVKAGNPVGGSYGVGIGDAYFHGGTGGFAVSSGDRGGGGGAGGYTNFGGPGGGGFGQDGSVGSGGGGGGGYGSPSGASGGGGVGLKGIGPDGTAGTVAGATRGGPGSNGDPSGLYGGGGAYPSDLGSAGGLRIIWGAGRSYPSNAADA